MLDCPPDTRIRRTPEGWTTQWSYNFYNILSPAQRLASLSGMVAPLMLNGFNAGAVVGTAAVSALLLVFLAWSSTRFPGIQASWDHERLRISGGRHTHDWALRSIDSLSLEKAEFVAVVDGVTHRIRGPSKVADRNRLLEHLAAHLEQRAPDFPTQPVVWTPTHTGMSTPVRIRPGENTTRTLYQRGAALALAGVLLTTTVASMLSALAEVVLSMTQSPWAGAAQWAFAAILILGALTIFSVLAGTVLRWSSAKRRGTISIGAHHLTIQAVDAQPLLMLWEDIEDIDGDDQTLTLIVGGRRATFDLSNERPEHVRGLVQELRARCSTVQAAFDEPEEAERRRRQLLGLVQQVR